MKELFFTSDTHFYHKNAISYCNRPFSSVEEMNEIMIENWNKTVTKDNEIYVLGDFSFAGSIKTKEVLDRLNGKKHLVVGNHDYGKLNFLKPRFISTEHLKILKIDNQDIIMCHFPFSSWYKEKKGCWNLHGHTHGRNPNTLKNQWDVGVDVNNFKPINCEEIKVIMDKRKELYGN